MQVIGKYEYGQAQLIGHGAFALVFKGHHTELGHPVAIKQILLKNIPDKMSNIREKEIAILKGLTHINIVQLFDCHEIATQMYIIMEFCNGGDLAEYLHAKKTLSEDSIRHLAAHISEALLYISGRGILHRDIKPQNLLLSYPSGKKTNIKDAIIKLADFGFARYLSGTDMAATLCGSPLYMAPEILLGTKYDGKADLWSAGTILYQCLIGSPPFLAKSPPALADKYKRETLVPRIPEGTSSTLTDLLLRLIKKSPRDRLDFKNFSCHPFIRGADATLIGLESSSSHPKSSPVPIRRSSTHTSPTAPSPRGQSSHSGGGVSSYMNNYVSPSSGPPTMHTIGSGSYRSPSSHLSHMPEDEGFVIINAGTIRRSPSSPQVIQPSHNPSSRYSSLNNPFYPQITPPTTTPPRHSQDKLSHTPPFSSLFKMSETRQASGTTPPSLGTTPPSHESPKATPPSVGSNSPVNSPIGSRRSLSHQGSHSKLATLKESKHESYDLSHDQLHDEKGHYMIDSTDLITPSLFGSDVLQEQLEKLSLNSRQQSVENMFDRLQKKDPPSSKEVPSSGGGSHKLSISRELADIRHQERSLAKRKESLTTLSGINLLSPDEDDRGCGLKGSPDSPLNEDIFRLDEDQGDRHLKALQYCMNVTHELLKLAKSRQGPMLMLSSSLGGSGGVVDHAQRFAEQLVLCVKAVDVISNGYRQYELEAAIESRSSTTSSHKYALDDAVKLKHTCLEKAKLARELYSKCLTKRRHQSVANTRVTAERLIFLQAADLCKQALMEEKSQRPQECIRKYQLSKLFLKLLASDARSELDRSSLKKYLTLIGNRIDILSKSLVVN